MASTYERGQQRVKQTIDNQNTLLTLPIVFVMCFLAILFLSDEAEGQKVRKQKRLEKSLSVGVEKGSW